MGYTHYFKLEKKPTQKQWNDLVEECKNLHQTLPKDVVVRDGMGENEPAFDNNEIWFNGDGDHDLDHETFHLSKEPFDFQFCKTARKPYDLLVFACLIAANKHIGLVFSSDCFNSNHTIDQEAVDAMDFYNKTIMPERAVKETDLWSIRAEYKS